MKGDSKKGLTVFITYYNEVLYRAVESESESESESVGIGCLAGIGIGKKLADSDSGPIE